MAAAFAPHAGSALTPPSSSHGGLNAWQSASPRRAGNSMQSKSDESSASRQPLTPHMNGNSLGQETPYPELQSKGTDTYMSSRSGEPGRLAPGHPILNRKGSALSENGSANESLYDLYETNRDKDSMNSGDGKPEKRHNDDDDTSEWIHRDKLARIENKELQAAGIVVPRARPQSKGSRRERSRDQAGNGGRSEGQKRQRIEDSPVEEQETEENMQWDLRMPDEASGDPPNGYRDLSGGSKGLSRIPVSKTSPLPIPLDYLERDTPISRSKNGSGDDDSITYPRSRGRSISMKDDATATPTPAKQIASDDTSPSKKTPSTRKPSNVPSARPKTRSGIRDTSSQQRPQTRGVSDINRRPEGDPPWLSNYKPDPRLPPDQQIIPTVAKRLQQEQWEKEGKFGNVYDTDFRPLSGEFDKNIGSMGGRHTDIVSQEIEVPKQEGDWPLRGSPGTPTLKSARPGTATGNGSYSTVPKVDSQRSPTSLGQQQQQQQNSPMRIIDTEEADDAKGKSKGCGGCCIVM